MMSAHFFFQNNPPTTTVLYAMYNSSSISLLCKSYLESLQAGNAQVTSSISSSIASKTWVLQKKRAKFAKSKQAQGHHFGKRGQHILCRKVGKNWKNHHTCSHGKIIFSSWMLNLQKLLLQNHILGSDNLQMHTLKQSPVVTGILGKRQHSKFPNSTLGKTT